MFISLNINVFELYYHDENEQIHDAGVLIVNLANTSNKLYKFTLYDGLQARVHFALASRTLVHNTLNKCYTNTRFWNTYSLYSYS